MCFDFGQASGSLQLLFWCWLLHAELLLVNSSCRTLGTGGFAGSEGRGPVILGKTLVVC